jgi:hypothetical protein
MMYWLLERVLRRGFRSRKGSLKLGQLENLARSGTGVWAMTQEKARQDYLEAKETFDQTRSWRAFEAMMERLLQLHSTNAIIQALINEHLLHQLLAKESADSTTDESAGVRKCA